MLDKDHGSTSTFDRVCRVIKELMEEQNLAIKILKPEDAIVDDLGFASLDVAALTARLELEFNVEPFSSGQVQVTDIRSIGGVCKVYDQALNKETPTEETNQESFKKGEERASKRSQARADDLSST